MSDAIFEYLKKRLSASLERCEWSDRIGSLFSQNIMPCINESITSMQNSIDEIDVFLKKVENELSEIGRK